MATQHSYGKIVSSGLVLYLNAADRNSYVSGSTTWTDLAATNNGTLINGPTYSSTNGGSIVFDGTNDYVNLGSLSQITPGTGEFTIEFWINPVNWSSTYSPILTTTITNGIWIGKNATNFVLRAYNVADDLQFDIFPTTNVWTNITVRRSGTTANIYYNTSSVATGTVTRNYAQGTTEIARDGTANVFNGRISTVRYYNRALSTTEILQNYNATKTRFGLT